MIKIKVIDLLNKIANGEEVPKKIEVYGDIFVLDEGNNIYESEKSKSNLLNVYNGNILNYEVEIIEEDKKIEHLDIYNCFKIMEIDKTGRLDENFTDISNKINEIIDKLNSIGE